mmetsp:Transcript_31528/g.38554  ORF Transcript_31528/g.38554 Transcript_31528/m.38554 type:complete len:356 (-) Transcript_31528:56-1123(-)|eukprot:CAMPEP_0172503858 /NCGR_PEP_ID=MMETSP1066-20121228/173085_1 /TAXON_ID=671091 /ORGANISM="Coscinodiscus wailesii, Strain CCMP2513" /LENGTH=355 /DNA_ID=CAMNT_0013279775 /DNA_START=172 /DNA_END=1239 /DNA_ORIENTATION=+
MSTISAPNTTIPEKMKRLIIKETGGSVKDCKIEIETDVPVPKPEPNQVLIKVAAAAINPSDYGSWTRYRPDQLPKALGSEGCGTVVATGKSFLATKRLPVGQKVGFVGLKNGQGAYSEYVVASATESVFAMPSDLPIEDAASFFVNPYTAIGILDTARSYGSKAFVHTAAASQLGQMMVKLAKQEGVEIINVVRREEQAKMLRELGAQHVVVTQEENWKDTLKNKIDELKATVCFDAVAGDGAGELLNLLPNKGTLLIYGGLAGPAGGIDPMQLIYKEKQITGFLLTNWIGHGGSMLFSVPRMLLAGNKVNAGLHGGWSSTQFKDTTLEKAQEDLVQLLEGSATGKKLRIRFDFV